MRPRRSCEIILRKGFTPRFARHPATKLLIVLGVQFSTCRQGSGLKLSSLCCSVLSNPSVAQRQRPMGRTAPTMGGSDPTAERREIVARLLRNARLVTSVDRLRVEIADVEGLALAILAALDGGAGA